MINPMILKMLASSSNCTNGNQTSCSNSVKLTGDFLSFIRKSLNSGQKEPYQQSVILNESNKFVQPGQNGQALKKNYRSYIESFKKAFLSRGKPLDQISLNQNDFIELKNFLSYCGFSRENLINFFNGLVENNNGQKINLSQFFNRLEKFKPSVKDSGLPVFAGPAALDLSNILHLESILKDFGFSPKEVDNIFNYAKLENGKLALGKLVTKLKEVCSGIKDSADHSLIIDGNDANQVYIYLEKMDIHLPVKKVGKTGDYISINHLITALEQKTEKPVNAGQLPGEVKAAIAKTAGKVGGITAEQGHASYLLSLFKPNLTALNSENKITEKNNILSFLQEDSTSRVQDQAELKKGNISNTKDQAELKKDNISNAKDLTRLNKKNILSFLQKDNTEKVESRVWQSKIRGVFPAKDVKLSLVSEPGSNIVSSNASDTVNTARQQALLGGSVLPKYLINQVGKKVSMSILRGDKVIKLQLKPPELGPVKIEMDIKENVLKLGVITQNNSVKELLLSNAHDLRRVLVEQGVKLDKLEVNINSDFGQSMTNSRDSQSQNQEWSKGSRSILSKGEGQPQTVQSALPESNFILDLMA